MGNLNRRITGKTKKACEYMSAKTNVHDACFFCFVFFAGRGGAPPWVCLRLYYATHRCIHVLQRDSVKGAEN